jgi:polyhydroxyalkanoate synthesis regulator phasin
VLDHRRSIRYDGEPSVAGEVSFLDAVRQWIHAGLDAIERARSGLHTAVDGLVEDGTINREQAEAVLKAWKRTTDQDPSPSSDESGPSRALSGDIFKRLQKLAPVSREDHDQLVARVVELEKRLGSD